MPSGDLRVGGWTVRPKQSRIERDGRAVHLRPKSMEVLVRLAQRAGQVATRDELLDAVWPGVSVAEEGLTRCIADIRGALEDEARQPAFVETVAKRGYRLIAPVEWIAEPETEAAPCGLVVLPFQDFSPEGDHEYFADGLTEQIIADLSQIRGLRVISRTSAMRLKHATAELGTIARDLRVRYALEGSLRRAGDSVRITTQLIDARSDDHLWAETYAGTVGDIFDIQEKVSRAIVQALRLKLTEYEDRRLTRRPVADVAAYDCYLRARVAINEFTADGVRRAIALLERGLEIAGQNPTLVAGLGFALFQRGNVGPRNFAQQQEDFREARRCAEEALRLDPDLPQAHLVLGLVLVGLDGRTKEGTHYMKRAATLAPNDPDALWWLAIAYANYVGRTSAALSLAERLAELDPLSPLAVGLAGVVHFCDGRFDLSVEVWRRAFPDLRLPIERAWLALGLAYGGRTDEALALVEPMEAMPGCDVWTSFGVLLKHALRGERDRAREVLTPEFTVLARCGAHFSWQVASLYARLDEREQAFDWLENAVNRGNINYPFLRYCDPFLEPLRREPRFERLMCRIKREWEEFEV